MSLKVEARVTIENNRHLRRTEFNEPFDPLLIFPASRDAAYFNSLSAHRLNGVFEMRLHTAHPIVGNGATASGNGTYYGIDLEPIVPKDEEPKNVYGYRFYSDRPTMIALAERGFTMVFTLEKDSLIENNPKTQRIREEMSALTDDQKNIDPIIIGRSTSQVINLCALLKIPGQVECIAYDQETSPFHAEFIQEMRQPTKIVLNGEEAPGYNYLFVRMTQRTEADDIGDDPSYRKTGVEIPVYVR